ncbi:MAG: hypothetical protein R2708_27170 [Vicinamibacterales bacterium]
MPPPVSRTEITAWPRSALVATVMVPCCRWRRRVGDRVRGVHDQIEQHLADAARQHHRRQDAEVGHQVGHAFASLRASVRRR